MGDSSYASHYRGIDFRQHPEKYHVGRGEQGVLIAEPYKSEILPHWKFKTPSAAQTSAEIIYKMFVEYGSKNDFVGMDMARKFLQMGFTRSRRYANHNGGQKYANNGSIKPQNTDWQTSEKAQSATIFYGYYKKAIEDNIYRRLKHEHVDRQS